MTALEKPQKFFFADSMRAAAIIMVLIIHSAIRYDVPPLFEIPLNAISALSRSCIAIFLFLSGFLLAKKEWTTIALLRRYKKILIPYAFFSVVAFLYADLDSIVSYNFVSKLKLLFRFLICHSFGIYYFVFVISITYLLHFFVVRFRVNLRLVFIFFGVVLILHHVFYGPVTSRYLPEELHQFSENRYIFWPFFFYLGVLKRLEPSFLTHAYRWLSNPIVVVVATILFLLLSSNQILNAPNYESLPCSLWSLVSIAALSRYYVHNRLVEFLSATSYFIYLFHIVIVYSLQDYVFPAFDLGAAKPFVSFVLSLLISVLCGYAVRRFGSSGVKRLLGIN